MTTDISQVFSDDKLISQAFVDSNSLFQNILTAFATDHDSTNDLMGSFEHAKVTFVTIEDAPTVDSGKAVLQKTGVSELTFFEQNTRRKIQTAQIPTFQLAYSKFSGTSNPVMVANEENVMTISAEVSGNAGYRVTFKNPVSLPYDVSAWALSMQGIVTASIDEKTASSFFVVFNLDSGSPANNITNAQITVFS